MDPYIVKPGDSLTKISMDLYGTYNRWEEIARLNNIQDPYIIQPGQVIQVPNSTGEGTEISPRVINDSLTVTAKAPPAQPIFTVFGFGITRNQLLITIAGIALLFGMPQKRKSYGTRKNKRKK